MFLQNLLNALIDFANKMGLQKERSVETQYDILPSKIKPL
jgi:hypothetical protein